jgi:hypothetical protein
MRPVFTLPAELSLNPVCSCRESVVFSGEPVLISNGWFVLTARRLNYQTTRIEFSGARLKIQTGRLHISTGALIISTRGWNF